MTLLEKNGRKVAVVDYNVKITTAQDLLDVFASVPYNADCSDIIVYKESLCEEFFDLKTRVAGDMLQKCSNYRIRFAVVGDFSAYTSKSLRDFIFESNKGNLVFFKSNLDSAIEALSI